tara:strand:- start:434 stop:628 length:195 start_codon:yes stop_codon:yes gene_type:complete
MKSTLQVRPSNYLAGCSFLPFLAAKADFLLHPALLRWMGLKKYVGRTRKFICHQENVNRILFII